MSTTTELIDALINYLQANSQVKGFWSISSLQELLIILQGIIVIISAACGVYKYNKSKNVEIYEKVLKEVYAPLYMRIIQQEYFREIYLKGSTIKEVPIISVVSETKSIQYTLEGKVNKKNISEFSFLDRDLFIDIIENTNSGLATKELITLIALYKSAIYIEDRMGKGTDTYFKNAILKLKIEVDLVLEIVRGYNYYYKKLDLGKSSDKHITFVNDEFLLKIHAEKEEIEKLIEDYNNDPEKYN